MARHRDPVPEGRAGAALALAALALAPVAVFAAKGTVVVLAATGLLLALSGSHRRAALGALADPLCLTLVAFLLWAALSAVWAPDPARSLILAARCALLFAAGLVCVTAAAGMPPPERAWAARGIAVGGALLLLLLAVETASDAALMRLIRGMDLAALVEHTHGAPLARGATLLSVFCWPAFLAAARLTGSRLAGLLVLPVLAILWFQWIAAPVVAAGVGLAAFGLVYAWPRPMLALLFGAFLVSLVAAPLLPPLLAGTAVAEAGATYLPLSWQHRIEIWQFAADRAAERPLLGWGFDAARVLGRAARSEVLPGEPLALHPHNFSLQVWLELGAVGASIAAAFGLLLLRRLWRMVGDRAGVATAAAALSCYLVHGQISRGAWQNWWLATAWLLAVMVLVVVPGRAPSPAEARPPARLGRGLRRARSASWKSRPGSGGAERWGGGDRPR